jgi:hypothetical protein
LAAGVSRLRWFDHGSVLALLLASFVLASGARAEPSSTFPAGFSVAAELQHAAFHVPGVPSVILHAPPGFDARGRLHLVVFLHGYSGCVPVLMGRGESRCRPQDAPREGWDLGSYHDAAHTNTLFIVPQLALMRRDGRPGTFAQRDGFRGFLEELLAGPISQQLGAARTLADVASLHLVAHSAGYQTALAIVERGGVTSLVKSLVLLDALYGETPRFARYVGAHAAAGLHFVSIALERGIPRRENESLLRRLRRSLGKDAVVSVAAADLAQAVEQHAIVIGVGTPPHRLLPATHLAEILHALHPGAGH